MKKRVIWSVALVAMLLLTLAAPLAMAQTEAPAEPGLVIVNVDAAGPAAKAGVKRGDILLALNGQEINRSADWFRALRGLAVGDEIELQLLHGDEARTLSATVAERNGRALLGLQVYLGGAEAEDADEPLMQVLPQLAALAGAQVLEVVADSPASAAGVQVGDVITAVDDQTLEDGASLADLIGGYAPGDEVTLTVVRAENDETDQTLTVVLGKNPDDATRPYLGVRYTNALSMEALEGQTMPFFGNPGGGFRFDRGFGQTMPDDEAMPESQSQRGALVGEVVKDGPAAKAGVQAGDLISAIDGEAVDSPQALVDALAERKPGDVALLTITGADAQEATEVEVTLGQHPDDAARAYLGVSVSAAAAPRFHGRGMGGQQFNLPFGLDQLPFDLNQLPFDLDQLPFDLDQLPFELPEQQQEPAGPQA